MTDNPNPSIEWLDEILENYKEYITGVYQGIANYDEVTAKTAILSHIEAEKREVLERLKANYVPGTKKYYQDPLEHIDAELASLEGGDEL